MSDFSFEKVNYSVRPNKSVERHLILDLLKALSMRDGFDLSDCRYMGFGSIWFVDFVLMHRILGVSDLVSFESVTSRTRRVMFNRPFGCVQIMMGSYAENFEKLDWGRRQIIWLDYDSGVRQEMFDDLKRTISVVPPKSFIAITVNADVIQLDTETGTTGDAREAQLRQLVGVENLPPDPKSRINRNKFPELLAEIWKNAFVNSCAARPRFQFVPMVDIHYSDGAPMITYGGLILESADAASFAPTPEESICRSGLRQLHLSIPHLTAREKLKFDQLVPIKTGTKTKAIAKKLGFELKDAEIESYVQHYLHYPLYGEYQF